LPSDKTKEIYGVKWTEYTYMTVLIYGQSM
jgi:hypothetical protein